MRAADMEFKSASVCCAFITLEYSNAPQITEAECKKRAKDTYQVFQVAKSEDVQEKPIDLAAQEAVAEVCSNFMEPCCVSNNLSGITSKRDGTRAGSDCNGRQCEGGRGSQ
jgi:hypothetical protein